MPKVTDLNHPLTQVRKALAPEFRVSQTALACLVGCSRSSIQFIENGKLKLSLDMALRIDSRLGSSLAKWVESKSDAADFSLDEEKLVRNFKLIYTDYYERVLSRYEGVERGQLTREGFESTLISDLVLAAKRKGKRLNIALDLIEWAEKENEKLGLGFDPYWHHSDVDEFKLVREIAYGMDDAELDDLGISRIAEPASHEDAAGLNVTTGFHGLDSN